MLPLPKTAQPEGSLSLFLSSRLCGRIPPKFSPLPQAPWLLPPPAHAGDECRGRREQRKREGPRVSTALVHSEAPDRARANLTGQPGATPGPSRRPASGHSDLEGPAFSPPRQQARPPARRGGSPGQATKVSRSPPGQVSPAELEAELQLPEPSAGRGARHGTPLPRGLRGTLARRTSPFGANSPSTPGSYPLYESVDPP